MFIYPRISKDVESLLALAGWLGDVFVPRVFPWRRARVASKGGRDRKAIERKNTVCAKHDR